jgi:hypothetical protein
MNKDLRFEVYHTGGNCTAWRLNIPGTKLHVLITQDLSHELNLDQPVEIGLYTDDDEDCVLYLETKLECLQFNGQLIGISKEKLDGN